MQSLILLSSLAATCLGAALPLLAREEDVTTVIITITSTTTLKSSTSTQVATTPDTPWFPWTGWPHTTSPVTVTITSPVYITVTATGPIYDSDPSPPPRITFYPPRNAAPEPQVLGSPTRTILQGPTPPWWHWWPSPTISLSEPSTTFYPRNAAPEPQVLGSPTRTILQSPTPPWWHWWPSPTISLSEPSTTFYPRDAAPEPQELGRPSRTVLESPTPPVPWWWNQWPEATAVVLIDREDEKREPQTIVFGSPGSRTTQLGPNPTSIDWTQWTVPHQPGHKHTSTPYEIDATATLPFLTLYKKSPQTLNFPSRTNQVTPTGPSKHHHHSTVTSTAYATITETPYEIDATATLPLLTLNGREPQSLGPPSRTNEITPTGPSTHHHHTPTSTVWVTITEYGPTSIHHHHSTSTTTDCFSATDDTPSPTGTEIDTTLTLDYPLPTIIGRDAEAAANPDPQLSVTWLPPITAPGPRPTTKENPCHNNIFPPPKWCSEPTAVVTITVTVTEPYTSIFEETATLPPLTLGTPPWGRKDRRARRM